MNWWGQQVLWMVAFVVLAAIKQAQHRKVDRRKLGHLDPDDVRLFEAELQAWPAVYRLKSGNYLLYAPHHSPGHSDRSVFPVVASGFIMAVGLLAGWATVSPVAAVGGVLLGAWTYPLWKDTTVVHLRVRFYPEDGLYAWDNPAGRLETVSCAELQELRATNHREGAEQQRRDDQITQRRQQLAGALERQASLAEQQNRHPDGNLLNKTLAVAAASNAGRPILPTYQTASELIVHVGHAGRHWLRMAEFRDDPHGETAYLLKTAVELVRDRCQQDHEALLAAKPTTERPDMPDVTAVDDDDI